jgi:hypothetical protein
MNQHQQIRNYVLLIMLLWSSDKLQPLLHSYNITTLHDSMTHKLH